MNKLILVAFFFTISLELSSQNLFKKDIMSFQYELNKHFSDTSRSPLLKEDLKKFRGLDFFPVNKKYKVKANFEKIFNPITVILKTTTDRVPEYQIYGKVSFILKGKNIKLLVYRSEKLSKKEEYKDYLFLPFTDLTNGSSSYGGGRYVDLRIPEGEIIYIDFNKAYNPYCAYNHKYSCVVPSAENDIPLKIKAGVKKFKKH